MQQRVFYSICVLGLVCAGLNQAYPQVPVASNAIPPPPPPPPPAQGGMSHDVGGLFAQLANNLTDDQKNEIRDLMQNKQEKIADVKKQIEEKFEAWGLADKFNDITKKFENMTDALKEKASDNPNIQKFVDILENDQLTGEEQKQQLEDVLKAAPEADKESIGQSITHTLGGLKDKVHSWLNTNSTK